MFIVVEFPRWQGSKPADAVPCTTRTLQSGDCSAAQLWESAEASLQTELSQDVLADASAIAHAERSRMHMREGMHHGLAQVSLSCLGGTVITGAVVDIGADWVLLAHEGWRATGIQLSTVLRAVGLEHRLPTESSTGATLSSWTQWLRSLVELQVGTVRLATVDGWHAHAEICYVGSDFLRMVDNDGQECDVLLCALSAVTIASMRLSG